MSLSLQRATGHRKWTPAPRQSYWHRVVNTLFASSRVDARWRSLPAINLPKAVLTHARKPRCRSDPERGTTSRINLCDLDTKQSGHSHLITSRVSPTINMGPPFSSRMVSATWPVEVWTRSASRGRNVHIVMASLQRKSGNYCAAIGCTNCWSQKSGIHLYRFPKDPGR